MGRRVRKTLNRLLVLVLSAVLVFGSTSLPGLGSSVSATENEAKVAGFSLTVSEGALGLNIFFSGISDNMAENCTAVVDGASYQLTDKQDDGTYKISHFVSPQNISKKISITLFSVTNKVALNNKNATDGVISYSVKDYLDKVKTNDDETGRLAKAIDDYGTCAEYYYAGAAEIPVTIADADFSKYKVSMTGGVPDGVSYYGSSLILSDTFAIRHYYSVTKIFDSYTSTIDGEPTEIMYDESTGLCYYEISGIRAWDIVHPYDLTVTCGGVTGSIKYSVMSYAEAAKTSEPGSPLYTLVKSIYWYYTAFQDCLNQQGHGGEVTTEYVTYSMYGAKGDGKTDDYAAIVATHEAANALNLPVKADPGATYYVHNMTSYKGAIIKTDTDWTGATFIIDDTGITLDEGEYYLFTVAPFKDVERRWMNGGISWKQKDNGTWTFKTDKKILEDGDTGYIKIRIGLDPNLDQYPLYNSYSAPIALTHLNKYIKKGQTQLDIGNTSGFPDRALYVIEDFKQRWGRNGSEVSSSPARNQQEVIIVNQDGSIDPNTPIQWPYDDDIYMIDKCFIDDTTLTVKGGNFITINNTINSRHYVNRGIHVTRSNTVIDGVKHKLEGENAQFTANSYYEQKNNKGEIIKTGYHARLGAPYHGFIIVDHCAFVTCRNCVFANHLNVYNSGNESAKTAPYDYYAEYAAAITLENCTCAPAKLFYFDYCKAIAENTALPEERYDEKGIFDESRWGTTATNYCKTIVVDNCSLNRVDAHMGAYNITIKDSEIGHLGIDVIGFGDLNIEGVSNYADRFINLRGDFGSFWEGNINIKNCYWNIGEHYNAYIIFADYSTNPTNPFGHDIITEGGVDYYSTLPTTINIDGLTVDARDMPAGGYQTYFYRAGVMVFSCPFLKPVYGPSKCVDEDWLNNRELYPYPLRAPKQINVTGFEILRSNTAAGVQFENGALNIRNDHLDTVHDLYFFHNTEFNHDSSIEQGIPEKGH